MGRKTRILRRLNKFGAKFANHPRLKNKKEEIKITPSLIDELPQPIKEEILETINELPVIEETVEVKTFSPPKKVVKPKK